MYIYFKMVSGVVSGNYIYFCKYKGFSDVNTTPPAISDYKPYFQLKLFWY